MNSDPKESQSSRPRRAASRKAASKTSTRPLTTPSAGDQERLRGNPQLLRGEGSAGALQQLQHGAKAQAELENRLPNRPRGLNLRPV